MRAAAFERAGLLQQRLGAPVQHLAGRRQLRLAPDDLEHLHAAAALDLLHGIGDRGLALVQRRGRLGIAAGVDHGQQGAPLLEGNARDAAIIYLIIDRYDANYSTFLSI